MFCYSVERRRAKREQIGINSTLPVTISSIRVIGAAHTRRSFLDRLFNPLLSANRDRPYTFAEALNEVGSVATKLQRFGTSPACHPNQL
jgi:outer membrane protein insertion porin family